MKTGLGCNLYNSLLRPILSSLFFFFFFFGEKIFLLLSKFLVWPIIKFGPWYMLIFLIGPLEEAIVASFA